MKKEALSQHAQTPSAHKLRFHCTYCPPPPTVPGLHQFLKKIILVQLKDVDGLESYLVALRNPQSRESTVKAGEDMFFSTCGKDNIACVDGKGAFQIEGYFFVFVFRQRKG